MTLSVTVETAENYGHSDVLDTIWSDLMHSTLISLMVGNVHQDIDQSLLENQMAV